MVSQAVSLFSRGHFAHVRYWHRADIAGFWPGTVCLLLTQSGHRCHSNGLSSYLFRFSKGATRQDDRDKNDAR